MKIKENKKKGKQLKNKGKIYGFEMIKNQLKIQHIQLIFNIFNIFKIQHIRTKRDIVNEMKSIKEIEENITRRRTI